MSKPVAGTVTEIKPPLPDDAIDGLLVKTVCAALTLALLVLAVRIATIW